MIVRLAANYSGSADGYAESWSPVIRPPGRWLEALPRPQASRILDVGTGTGAFANDILGFAPSASSGSIRSECSPERRAIGRLSWRWTR